MGGGVPNAAMQEGMSSKRRFGVSPLMGGSVALEGMLRSVRGGRSLHLGSGV